MISIISNLPLKERLPSIETCNKKKIERLIVKYKSADILKSIENDLENCIGANNKALINEYMLKPRPPRADAVQAPA